MNHCDFTGFPEEHEEAYKSFPGVLLAVRYIREVVSSSFSNSEGTHKHCTLLKIIECVPAGLLSKKSNKT